MKVLSFILHLIIVLLQHYAILVLKFDESCLKQDKVKFTHGKTVNIYIVYKINLLLKRRRDFTWGSALFGALELVKNADQSKYKYSEYGIGFGSHGTSAGSWYELFYTRW